MYQRMVRTNNDLEGYHWRLNKRCESEHPQVYKLLEVLHDEAKLVNFTCTAISSSAHVAMIRRKRTRDIQAKLQKVWDQFEMGLIDSNELLKIVGEFITFPSEN